MFKVSSQKNDLFENILTNFVIIHSSSLLEKNLVYYNVGLVFGFGSIGLVATEIWQHSNISVTKCGKERAISC